MPVLPDFEVTVLLQIELKRKMLGRSVTFEPNSIEKCFQKQNCFELTTQNPTRVRDQGVAGRNEREQICKPINDLIYKKRHTENC